MNHFDHDSESTDGLGAADDELVAAYVFGELDPSERTAFEARLDSDPVLRARRDAFAAVSRQVRENLGEPRVLSPAAHAGLALAARRTAAPKARVVPIGLAAAALVAATLVLLDASPESVIPRGRDRAREVALAPGERREDVLVAALDEPIVEPSDARTLATVTVAPEPAPPSLLPLVEPFTIGRIQTLPQTPLMTVHRAVGLSDAELRARVDALHDSFERSRTTAPPWANPDASFPAGPVILESFERTPEGVGADPAANPGRRPDESIWTENESRVDFFLGGFLNPTHDPVSTTNPDPSDPPAQPGSVVVSGNRSRIEDHLPIADSATPSESEAVRILRECERRPDERPSDMFFRFWGDNAFERAALDPTSTFAIDVDRASYTLARAYLDRGVLPEKAQIRTEEFLNYFPPDVAAPTDRPIAVGLELAPSPFSSDRARSLLRVTLRARDVSPSDRTRQQMMLVVDVSGSMKEGDRLELVKHALRLLVGKLRDDDRVGITTFSDEARLVLPMTAAADRATIESAIHSMRADGSTNAAAGLAIGFRELAEKFDGEAENRVVLFSDGVANVGATDAESILGSVAERRSKGIYLSTVGVGMNNHDDALLEQLADRGDGICSYVDSDEEAKRAIVERFSGAFVTIARDVKVQVRFDPRQVERYRLLGYENRAVADHDFRNDAVDAGEFGAGDQVTALYEIEPASAIADAEPPLAAITVRWLAPHGRGGEAGETTVSRIVRSETFESASAGFRRSALVAQFAELLRRSTHARGDSIDALLAAARRLAPELGDPRFDEFVALVDRSRECFLDSQGADDPLTDAIDALRRNRILKAELEDLAGERRAEIVERLEEENRKLEELLRRLLGG